ncbi:hypothetical protein STAS_07640 [Striga asiatica]|uniref:QWRF motif-containing protein 3 n=1 Tax=Striga asiatica TaxID=4170 RepID=A0A5A7PFZ8_STRAF|nr:hypothetical protein STAS_07640 [Striga asiatica]
MSSHVGPPATSDRTSSPQPKKPKSREVSSRFLSPAAPSAATTAAARSSSSSSSDFGNQSPNSTLIFSPRQKHKQPPANFSRKHKSYENSGFFRGLWPSSSPKPSKIAAKSGDRSLTRQKSCTEFSRFDDRKIQISNFAAKDNQKPGLGGSMRYTGKPIKFEEKSDYNDLIAPGRFSIDKDVLLSSDELGNSSGMSLETPAARKYSPASYMAPTLSSRKHGLEPSRSRRWSADSGPNLKPVVSSSECNNNNFSSSSKVFNLKNAMKKADGNGAQSGSGKSKSGEEKGKMKSILSLGIGLLKGKKPVSSLSPFGPGSSYDVHQLKLLHNRLMQLRYINARAKTVNGNVFKQAECNFLFAWHGMIKLQHSVVQNKLQLQREKLEMKLSYIIHSQIQALENWGNMETQHLSAVCTTIDYLHSVICRVPLVDGVKVEPQLASISIRHASDLAASIDLMLTNFSPTIEKTVGLMDELAMVVTQEKLLLQECLELFRNISILEMQERSLKSSIMQFSILQQDSKITCTGPS